ncbi:MAG: Potassium efflux system protein KefA [Chlorobi bacterium OLB7]|nr:MAG: Potassium efflux system protein KefA [Chlorobi bacterium OLB7]
MKKVRRGWKLGLKAAVSVASGCGQPLHSLSCFMEFSFGNLQPILVPLAYVVGAAAAGFLIHFVMGTFVHQWAKRTAFVYDDVIVSTLRTPLVIATILLGIWMAMEHSQFSAEVMRVAAIVLEVLLLLLLTVSLGVLSQRIIRARADMQHNSRAATGVIQTIVQICLYAFGFALILSAFGVNITAILTALGVGGLALALALQDTLSNLFGGIYITLANQIRVGDYVEIAKELEGVVTDINWRTTTIRTLDSTLVIIPNSKLSQATVTNLSLPERHFRMAVTVTVDYSSDPHLVEQTLIRLIEESGHENPDAAEATSQPAGKIRGLLCVPRPEANFHSFGDSYLTITFMFWVRDYRFRTPVRNEVIKKTILRFRELGIQIPFPQRVVRFAPGVRWEAEPEAS